jgi:hypothetical protein
VIGGAVSAVAVAVTIALGWSIGSHAAPPTPTSTTARATATPTATATPDFTPTPTAQQLLDRQARAAIPITLLATTQVDACVSTASTVAFSHGDSIWINLCVAASAPSGSMTVTIQRGTTILHWFARNQAALPGYRYSWAYFAANLTPGTYDLIVAFNGGTASNTTFTVQ